MSGLSAGSRFGQLVAARWIGGAALALLVSSCCFVPASERPQKVDFQPILDGSSPGYLPSVLDRFPAYENLMAGDERARKDGRREFLKRRLSFGADRKESVEVRVMLFDSDRNAASSFESFCEYRAGDHVVWGDDRLSCWSPVTENRADPEGLCISSGTYSSVAGVRKGNLVVTFVEDGADPDYVATNGAVAEVAVALLVDGPDAAPR